MIADLTTLFNLALNAIGARKNVASPVERSVEAETCNLWYPIVRDQVLSSAPWQSAKDFRRLAELAAAADQWASGQPEPGFLYAFSLPENFLYPRYLASYAPFTIASWPGDNKALMANEPNPILVYTKRQETISLWEQPLQMAVMYGLAANICMPLTGKPQRAQLMLSQANDLITTAQRLNANADNFQVETLPDWITARGYSGSAPAIRFYWPNGALLATNVS